MNEAGVYVFKIGGSDVEAAGGVILPDVDPMKQFTARLADDCLYGAKTCHSKANCLEGEEGGFCCK